MRTKAKRAGTSVPVSPADPSEKHRKATKPSGVKGQQSKPLPVDALDPQCAAEIATERAAYVQQSPAYLERLSERTETDVAATTSDFCRAWFAEWIDGALCELAVMSVRPTDPVDSSPAKELAARFRDYASHFELDDLLAELRSPWAPGTIANLRHTLRSFHTRLTGRTEQPGEATAPAIKGDDLPVDKAVPSESDIPARPSLAPYLDCMIDREKRSLARGGQTTEFASAAVSWRFLLTLYEAGAAGIENQKLFDRVWPGADYAENNLAQAKNRIAERLAILRLDISASQRGIWKLSAF